MKRLVFLLLLSLNLFAQNLDVQMRVDWSAYEVQLKITYPFEQSKRPLPGLRQEASRYIDQNLNIIIQKAIYNISVNSQKNLGSILSSSDLFFIESVVRENQRKMYLDPQLNSMHVELHLPLFPDLGRLFVQHENQYLPRPYLNFIDHQEYSGIVIYAADALPAYGTDELVFLEASVLPKVYSSSMSLVYESIMTDPGSSRTQGIVQYTYSYDVSPYAHRIGENPLRILAKGVFGTKQTDIIIAESDARRILVSDHNRKLLQQGRLVIVLPDRD